MVETKNKIKTKLKVELKGEKNRDKLEEKKKFWLKRIASVTVSRGQDNFSHKFHFVQAEKKKQKKLN